MCTRESQNWKNREASTEIIHIFLLNLSFPVDILRFPQVALITTNNFSNIYKCDVTIGDVCCDDARV